MYMLDYGCSWEASLRLVSRQFVAEISARE